MADLGSLLRLKSRVSGVSPYLEPLGKILSPRSFSVVVEFSFFGVDRTEVLADCQQGPLSNPSGCPPSLLAT